MKYKDSQIGLIPDDWILTELDSISKIIDSLHQTPKYSDKGYAMVRVTDIKQGSLSTDNCLKVDENTYKLFTKNHKPEMGDILISRVGSYGICSYVKTSESFCIGQNTAIISPQINSKYLYYSLINKTTKDQIEKLAVGSTQKTLSLKNIKSIKIPICSEKEQKSIANILSNLDDKIEINNKINENLQSISQLLFKHWFIDFEFPNEEGLPYKSSGGEMVDSELGLIPKGWEVKRMDEVKDMGTLIMGQSPSGSSYNKNKIGMPLINGAADIKNGNLVPTKYTTEPKKISKKRDLIFCIRATIGLLTISDGEYCLGRGVACITNIEDSYYEYIYQIIDDSFEKFKKTAGGSVYINLSKDDFNNMKLIVPTYKVLEKYHSVCGHMLELITINKKQILKLMTLRDNLLPKLMNGEIDLTNLELNH